MVSYSLTVCQTRSEPQEDACAPVQTLTFYLFSTVGFSRHNKNPMKRRICCKCSFKSSRTWTRSWVPRAQFSLQLLFGQISRLWNSSLPRLFPRGDTWCFPRSPVKSVHYLLQNQDRSILLYSLWFFLCVFPFILCANLGMQSASFFPFSWARLWQEHIFV